MITCTARGATDGAMMGLKESLHPSISGFNGAVFSAMGWFYTGTLPGNTGGGDYTNIFTFGHSEVPFASGPYVWVGLHSNNELMLEVKNNVGPTGFFSGQILLANTRYWWAYVRGATANGHRVYLSPDSEAAAPALVIDITQVDNLTGPKGIFWHFHPTAGICSAKLGTTVKTLANLTAERGTWMVGSSGAVRQVAPLRFPLDPYNYAANDGGTAFDDPTFVNGYRSHLVNYSGDTLRWMADPATLLTRECPTGLTTAVVVNVTDDPGVILSGALPIEIDRTQYQMDEDTALGLPQASIIQSVRLEHTDGHFGPAFFISTRYPAVGTVSGVNEGDVPVGGFGDQVQRHIVETSLESTPYREPILLVSWNTLSAAVARANIFAYFWGWISLWYGGGNIVIPLATDAHTTTDLRLRLSYTLPADWTLDPAIDPDIDPEAAPPVDDEVIADFDYSPSSPNTNQTVTFTADDQDGDVTIVTWDFGDGDTGTGLEATHTYTTAGTYTVTLTVEDAEGNIDTQEQQIVVVAPTRKWYLIRGWR